VLDRPPGISFVAFVPSVKNLPALAPPAVNFRPFRGPPDRASSLLLHAERFHKRDDVPNLLG
jgi:hypothetical protein